MLKKKGKKKEEKRKEKRKCMLKSKTNIFHYRFIDVDKDAGIIQLDQKSHTGVEGGAGTPWKLKLRISWASVIIPRSLSYSGWGRVNG